MSPRKGGPKGTLKTRHEGAYLRYNPCYTTGVKTAISLPEGLFRRAEAAARKLKMSRSQLYATAIAEFIERRQAAKITQRLNEIYSSEPASIDSALSSAQSKLIEKENPGNP